MVQRVFHVDVDAFFASVEQALNPALKGRPVVVGGNREQRTVVASCSYEARARGVYTAMRTALARQTCPEAVFLEGDHRVYRRAADMVFSRLRELSPRVQATSLDEAYVEVELKDGESSALPVAEGLCRDVRETLDLDLSVGIGTNMLAARMATRLAKPHGCFLLREGQERSLLWSLPIRELPGIGRRTAELLDRFHLPTIGDLAQVPRDLLVETFGRRGGTLHDLARGRDERRVDPFVLPRSVSRETSFEEPPTAFGEVFAMACWLLERAMKELKDKQLSARTVAVRLRTIDGHASERMQTLPVAIVHEANLVPVVKEQLRRLFTRRVAVQLVGVTLKGLAPDDERQGRLFEEDDDRRLDRLDAALTRIRARHGFGAVIKGPPIELLTRVARDEDGFRMRIPSLTR